MWDFYLVKTFDQRARIIPTRMMQNWDERLIRRRRLEDSEGRLVSGILATFRRRWSEAGGHIGILEDLGSKHTSRDPNLALDPRDTCCFIQRTSRIFRILPLISFKFLPFYLALSRSRFSYQPTLSFNEISNGLMESSSFSTDWIKRDEGSN